MAQIKMTGGARIGLINETWPCATMTVTKDLLNLKTLLGTYSFSRDDITSIEPYAGLISRGLKINHNVANYNEKVIFWTLKNPNKIINEIRRIGFFDSNSSLIGQAANHQITENQKKGGFPIKIPFAIGVVIIWNILLLFDLIDLFKGQTESITLGKGAVLANGFIVITSLAIFISNDFRKLVLKEGRELNDVKRFLFFIIMICGFMMINIWPLQI
jgi:hypothetical protein